MCNLPIELACGAPFHSDVNVIYEYIFVSARMVNALLLQSVLEVDFRKTARIHESGYGKVEYHINKYERMSANYTYKQMDLIQSN